MWRTVAISLLLAFWPLAGAVAQQGGSVSGRVTDQASQPLVGAQVVIQGTEFGSLTNAEGRYQINGIPPGEVVVSVRGLGYVAAQQRLVVTAGATTNADFALQVSAINLDEIVAVGYGTQRRETLTGSIASVSGEEIAVSPSPNVVSSLAGRLPGLVVNQRTGDPGRENVNILIRGTGTFRDNAPLVIVDGVERSLLGRLNPDDIESVTVLKDASAAIYGARAANGVILVTTRQGSSGQPTFNASISQAFSRPTRVPQMLDAATFAEAFNEAEWYRQGRPAAGTPFYSPEAVQRFRDGSDPVQYPSTDWMGELLKPYSIQRRANVQASGGSGPARYLLSFSALDQPGNFRNDPTEYRQYNIRTRVDADLTNDLSVSANLSGILNRRIYPSVGSEVNFVNILQANPTLVSRYPNGLIGPGRLGENPLLLDQRGATTIEDTPLYSTFSASYDVPFASGLTLDASYNYDLSNQFEKNFITPYYFHEYDGNSGEYVERQGTGSATVEVRDTYRKWTTSLYNLRATYQRTFAQDHAFALMLGTEQQKNTFRFANAYRKEFVSPAIPQLNAGSSDPENKDNSGSASESAYNNYLGRLNYDFRSKYLLELLFRYDGSQIFPEGNRYGFFPGVSAGWRLSEEAFFQDRFPFVNEFKLRASYGELGNDRVGQYQYLQAFSFGGNYVFGGSDAPGIFANSMPNTDITWEVSRKTDVGLEAIFWDGLLGVDFTFWREERSNILAQPNLSVSRIFGFPGLPDQNIGRVNNRGYELTLSHQGGGGADWSYGLTGNMAFARSEIVFMDEVPQAEPYQSQTGRPVGAGLFYKADGIFRTQDELDSYPHGAGAEVGDIRVVDLNNDGVIDSRDMYRLDASNVPEIVGGLTADFRYRNLDLQLFFQGQTNARVYDGTASALGGSDFANATVQRAADRWSASNPNGSMPRAGAWQPGGTTFFLYDATFARLKTAEVGYRLPSSLISRLGTFDSARLYVSGFNLLTWAKELKWADPELAGNFTQYPPLRTINLGLNVSF